MTKIITIIVFFICSLMSAQNVNLTVTMSGLKNDEGVVKVGLYNSKETFLKKPYKRVTSKIKNNEVTVTLLTFQKENMEFQHFMMKMIMENLIKI